MSTTTKTLSRSPLKPTATRSHVYISPDGLKAVLAFLVHDDSPADPFEEFEEGEFFQFDRSRKHDADRPELEDWKRIIRANPGRVVTVDSRGDEFTAGTLMTAAMCRGKYQGHDYCQAEAELDSMDGYYIAPENVPDPLQYAVGALETYSQWCNGDVYGLVVWAYTRTDQADSWGDPDRDRECWGYYGRDGYTTDELQSEFDAACQP
jgi:hypothetical protein